jgi:hypothetical protein
MCKLMCETDCEMLEKHELMVCRTVEYMECGTFYLFFQILIFEITMFTKVTCFRTKRSFYKSIYSSVKV